MRAVSRSLVGRKSELERLQAALESARTGAAVVVVAGEAGIGKTRLLATFLDGARDQGARVLVGTCASTADAGVAFAPLADALARLLREDQRAADAWAPSVRSALAPLLPGARLETNAAPAILDHALPEAIRSLAGPPLILAIEDVHWADVSTRRVLDRLARSAGCPGLLLLVTARTGDPAVRADTAAWLDAIAALAGTAVVDLAGLDTAAVTALAQDVLGAPPSPAVAARLARAEGNPLFAEQLLEQPDDAVPATVRQLAAARAARLPGTVQRVLRAAAVLAASSTVLAEKDVGALTGLDLDAVAVALRRGVAAGLLSAGRAGVQFRHSLLRDAVEEGLLPSERAHLHSLAAARLESAGSEVTVLARAAYHRAAAGEGRPAVAALRRAGRAQRSILALPEAAYHYEQAVDIVDAERIELDDQADFLEEAAAALYLGTHDARAPELARRALAFLRPSEQRRRARLHLLAGEATWGSRSDASAALAEVEAGIAVAGSETPAAVLAGRARFLMLLERWRDAEREAAVAVEAGRHEGDLSAVASALVTRGNCMTWVGDPVCGLRLMRAGRRVASRCGDVVSVGRSYVNRLEAMRHLGLLERSAVEGKEGIRAGRELGLDHSVVPAMAHILVLSLADLGRCGEADEVLEQAGPAVSANLSWRLAEARGRLALARGDVAAALLAAEEAMAHLVEEAQVLEPCLTLRAEALLEAGRPAQALEDAERAVQSLAGARDLERVPRALWLAARAAAASGTQLSPALLHLAHELEARSLMPELAAYRTLASAELSAGAGAIAAWRDAEAAWLRVGSRPRRLYATLRLAHAELATGSRAAGRARLREAHAAASDAGFEGLERAAVDVAHRSRVALGPARTETRPAGLTPRELDVLRLLAVGRSNRQIAADLFISENTTEVHVSRVLSKLGLSRRAEAAAYAHAHHLIDA